MTLNEVIMRLTMLWNQPTCPETFKPELQKVIEALSELEEPEETSLKESCEIERYAETCEECGFCDTISRQQAGKAVKEPVKPVYVWVSTSLKEIEAVDALVQNVIKQAQAVILARIEELPVQCDNRPVTINMNLDEEQAKRMLEMLKEGGATFVLPEPDKPAVVSDDWLRGDAPGLSNNPQKLDSENGELQPWEVLAAQAILKQPEQRRIPQEYPKRDYWVKHYKGGIYKVLNLGVKHTETGEFLVVYLDVYGQIWARPESMFYGLVEVNGEQVPRYAKIAEKEVVQLGDGTIFVRTE